MPTHPTASELAPEQAWFKSSYSDGTGQNCIEATHLTPTGPALLLPASAWTPFVAHLQR